MGGERAQQAAYSLPSPWAAARKERLRLCTQSACRFSPIAHRTSLQYGKYSCVSSARSEEKSADAFCAQSLCAATLLFSRALFSTTLPTLGENERAEPFPRFHDIDLFISVLCSIMGMCNLQVYAIGGWGRRKAGDWGRKPGRGRGIAAGLPPFPWVVSPRQR